ncbi:MAG TPA: LysR family transcriptional regulator [Arsenicitalea sp.]|jgi:DNA-binding transcriptional LysR family regulator|nr:LysR family transcriptional regulator [Arsenicitalea sp.]
MNIKQLDIFRTVVATGSTIAASQVLGLSQSAISRQITGLEEEIGVSLFQREKGRLVLLPGASSLLEEIGELGEILSRIRRTTDDMRAGIEGDTLLRLAFPHSLTTTFLPGLLKDFIKAEPRVTFDLLSGPYEAIERMVTSRHADFGFVRLPTDDPAFGVQPLLASDFICVMPADHALANQPSVTLRELAHCDMLLLGRLKKGRQQLEQVLRDERIELRWKVETHSVEATCKLVEEGLGVSLVPAFIAKFLISDKLRFCPCEPSISNDYGIIHRRDAPPSPVAQRFIDLVAARLNENQA